MLRPVLPNQAMTRIVLVILGAFLAGLPVLAQAHLGPTPFDLDAWLESGPLVVGLEVTGEPVPCGPEPGAAVLPVRMRATLFGEAPPVAEILVGPGTAAGRVPDGVLLAVLSETGPQDGAGCARVPRLVARRLPEPLIRLEADPEAWRAYVAARRTLGGRADPAADLERWTLALAARDPSLAAHGSRALGAAAAAGFPQAARERLQLLVEDAALPESSRLAALRLVAPDAGAVWLAQRCADPSLRLTELALRMLIVRGPRAVGPEVGRVLAGIYAQAGGDRPADRIRRVGLAATLAVLGDARGRAELLSSAESRLFKVRSFVIEGLIGLVRHGDAVALEILRSRAQVEPDSRLQERALEALAVLSPRPPPAPSARAGLRALLVLAGLACLAAMLFLPRLTGRRS